MMKFKWIVGLAALLVMVACGQKGALVLPQEPAAQNRATLPQVLNPTSPASNTAIVPQR
jgi:predicted small lipoprotein YifL